MEKYLQNTPMLDITAKEIVELIESRQWNALGEFDKIGAIYDFVQNEILLGYNKYDEMSASEVLKDGYGQCNTKATLLLSLLRAVGIPCRLHESKVTKVFQRSLMLDLMARLAPPEIVHTWAEVLYQGKWLSLEGVIADKAYLKGLQTMFPRHIGKFFDYAVAVEDFAVLHIDWNGTNTTIQRQAMIEDLGVFDTPDEFFAIHKQSYRGLKKFLYENFGRSLMTKKVAKIRRYGKTK